MRHIRLGLRIIMVVALMTTVFRVPSVHATISGCTASVGPHTIEAGVDSGFTFTVENLDSAAVQWLRIAPGGDHFLLQSSYAGGWNSSVTGSEAVFTGGQLPQTEQGFVVGATAVNGGTDVWSVTVSDDPGGANAVACTGDTSVVVTTPPPPPVSIYNVRLANLTPQSVTVLWETDISASSVIDYGTTTGYGRQATGSAGTSHSIVLAGLQANTAYHYRVTSQDEQGNITSTGDNTMLTPLVGTTPIAAPPSTPSLQPITKIPIKSVPTEAEPPAIRLTTTLEKIYKEAPTLKGEATDNDSLAAINYSTDGGKNWLPVDQAPGLGSRKSSFQFKPANLPDGDYSLVVRAIDVSGNQGKTAPQTFVIDLLPPQVGGMVLAVGPQILQPRSDGVITSVPGVDHRVTLSAIGGATTVTLGLRQGSSSEDAASFSLTRAQDSGLWSGVVSLPAAGLFQLVAHSVDGAGNQVTRSLGRVYAVPPPRVLAHEDSRPLAEAVTTLFYLQPETNSWDVWDASAYGQANPQTTGATGEFHYFVPPGKYYLQVKTSGRQLFASDIFETGDSVPLTANIVTHAAWQIKIGSWRWALPSWIIDHGSVMTSKTAIAATTASLDGQPAPNFVLSSTAGRTVRPQTIAGKPTVLSFISSWSPAAKDQLASLNELGVNADVNVMPVFVQEGAQKAAAYLSIGQYKLEALADPSGQTVESYQIQGLPTNYFLDRRGHIKTVVVGVLSKTELLNYLVGR